MITSWTILLLLKTLSECSKSMAKVYNTSAVVKFERSREVWTEKVSYCSLQSVTYFPTRANRCAAQGKADTDDWKKLKKVVQHLKVIINILLILGAVSLLSYMTFVDVAYAVHNDMRNHTCGVITFGRGTIYAKLLGQKLNTKSSNEREIVGVSDYLLLAFGTNISWKHKGILLYVIFSSGTT